MVVILPFAKRQYVYVTDKISQKFKLSIYDSKFLTHIYNNHSAVYDTTMFVICVHDDHT